MCLNDISWHQLCGSKLMPKAYLLRIRNIVFSLLYLGAFVVYSSHCDFYSTLQNMKFRSIDPSIMWVYTGDAAGVVWVYTGDAVGVLWVYQKMLLKSCECTTWDATEAVMHTLKPSFWCPRKELWLREGRIKLNKRRVSHCLFWLLFNLKMNRYQILY